MSLDKTALVDEITDIRGQMEDLVKRFLAAQKARSNLENEKARVEAENATLNQQLAESTTRYNLNVQQLALLKDDLLQKDKALTDERQKVESTQQLMVALKGDYVDLEQKYNKLVRPARSPEGRHVVEVRITKSSGINFYSLRSPGEAEASRVTLEQLHARLSAAKQQHPNNLYTRIIIPDDSGLSYNEAWSFTNDILSKYDYYHQ